MLHATTLPVLYIGGAFQGPQSPWSSKITEQSGIISVPRVCDWNDGINDQAEKLFAHIKTLSSPVCLIGHSLGALVAYLAHQLDKEGKFILRSALFNCGSIGEPMPVTAPSYSLQLIADTVKVLTHPEPPKVILEAALGEIQIGKRRRDMTIYAGTHDQLIPLELAGKVSRLIGAKFRQIEGGHDLPGEDTEGLLLNEGLKWLHTGKSIKDK